MEIYPLKMEISPLWNKYQKISTKSKKNNKNNLKRNEVEKSPLKVDIIYFKLWFLHFGKKTQNIQTQNQKTKKLQKNDLTGEIST